MQAEVVFNLGNVLKAARITQADLARELNMSKQQLNEVIINQRASFKLISRIYEALSEMLPGLELADLVVFIPAGTTEEEREELLAFKVEIAAR